MNLTADDTATNMVLPVEQRASKRTFDEVDENVAEEPNSDEVYGWVEDDGVAAEGLITNDIPTTFQDATTEERSTKVMRTSTL